MTSLFTVTVTGGDAVVMPPLLPLLLPLPLLSLLRKVKLNLPQSSEPQISSGLTCTVEHFQPACLVAYRLNNTATMLILAGDDVNMIAGLQLCCTRQP